MDEDYVGAEQIAHCLLSMVGRYPGECGRLRAARIMGGFGVAFADAEVRARFEPYGIRSGWTLRELVTLVDAMIDGGLLVQTSPPRPTLCLSIAGFHALTALDEITNRAAVSLPIKGECS